MRVLPSGGQCAVSRIDRSCVLAATDIIHIGFCSKDPEKPVLSRISSHRCAHEILILSLFFSFSSASFLTSVAQYLDDTPFHFSARICCSVRTQALPNNAKVAKDGKDTVQECVSEFVSFITSDKYIDPLKQYLARYRETVMQEKGDDNPNAKKEEK